ncbi:hypothetical protein LTR37_004387 [Vermiconidia calcicola]|uniref:Uncharacterized protein n=1 Tax=Vermiconidia calcicola TaxID=1690605 RepID=A0ACC3NP30_9PEZI|nr:hypothetical protein LTR37_004387 [Vermiconidia calcicola]
MNISTPTTFNDVPTELKELIAAHLDTKTLKAFRQVSQECSGTGWRPITERVSRDIKSSSHPNLTPTALVQSLIIDVQDAMPEAAARVKKLTIAYACGPYERIPRSFAAVKLSSLQSISLQLVSVTKASLLTMLREHRRTLRTLKLNAVAIDVVDLDHTPATRKLRRWTSLIAYAGTQMNLNLLSLNSLTWYDAATDGVQDIYVQTPHAKYHHRYLDIQRRSFYKLSNGGLVALCAVREGAQRFIEEVNKSLLPAPSEASTHL